MPVVQIPLADSGLLSVEAVAARHGCTPRAVQRWVADGLLPAHVIGSGNRTVYLIRARDLKRFAPPARGRPATPTS
jgi:hypothetical protein